MGESDIESKVNALERRMVALEEQLRDRALWRELRQGLLQQVAAIEAEQGTEPRTADLRKLWKKQKHEQTVRVDKLGKV